jgi:NAD(P)-dependent dehydrogenase (short-subunit alcohol dehydrogenase family)
MNLRNLREKLRKKIAVLDEDINLDEVLTPHASKDIQLVTYPFKHIVIDDFLSKKYAEGLETFFSKKRSEGLTDDVNNFSKFRPFSYKDRVYDGYLYVPKFGEDTYFDFFFSNTFMSLVSGYFSLNVNNMFAASFHHHPKLNNDGWVHTDDASFSFLKKISLKNGLILGGEKYYDEEKTPKEFVGKRVIAFLYYLNNSGYKEGDGGETGLFLSDSKDSLYKKIEPINNRLLLFKISPKSHHAFLKNFRDRNCIAGFLHAHEDESTKSIYANFFRKLKTKNSFEKVFIEKDKKIVVVFGGSGQLGKVLFTEIQKDVVIVNIARKTKLEGKNVYNYFYNITTTEPKKIIADLVNVFGRIDVVVYGTYVSHFKNARDIEDSDLYEECYLSVSYPLKLMKVLETLWGESSPAQESFPRKFIAISSSASVQVYKERPDITAYATFKAGMNTLCEQYSLLFEKINVETVVFCPNSFSRIADKFYQEFWDVVNEKEKGKPFMIKTIL